MSVVMQKGTRGIFSFVFIFFVAFLFMGGGRAMATSDEGHGPEKGHASGKEEHRVAAGHNEEDEALFLTIPGHLRESFKPAVSAYRDLNNKRAVSAIKRLMKEKGEVGQAAAFFLGDFYLFLAKKDGNKETMDEARRAFEKAIEQYPGAKNADKTLLTIGTIYLKQQRYYGALDRFKRILSEYPNSPYAASAQVGVAQAAQGFKKWDDVIAVYEGLESFHPSLADRQAAEFLYADALYQQGRFDAAYQQYKKAVALMPDYYQTDTTSVFQYGESAHRTDRHAELLPILSLFYSSSLKDAAPSLPLALARLSNIARQSGEIGEAEDLSNIVYTMKPDRPGVKEAKIIISTGKVAVLNCPTPCSSNAVTQSAKHITKEIDGLLREGPASTTAQGVIIDWLMQLKRSGNFAIAEEVNQKFLTILPPSSPHRAAMEGFQIQVVLEHFDSLEKPEEVVALYQTFRSVFPPERRRGPMGLKLAQSYLALGFPSYALDLFKPVAANTAIPEAEEALYQVGMILAKRAEYKKAQLELEAYQKRYPQNYRILAELAEVYDQQGKMDLAIDTYGKWLRHYPKDPGRNAVFQKLADAYSAKKDLKKEIAVYLEWIKEIPKEANRPYMGLADAYYNLHDYKNAVTYYDLALKTEKKGREIDWARLRLATAYRAMGDTKKGLKLIQEIAKNGKDPLIKQVAFEQEQVLSLKPVVKIKN